MQTKICKTCGVEKTLDNYSKGKSNSMGVIPHCKLCVSIKTSKNRRANLEESLRKEAEYRAKNKASVDGHKKAYIERNRDRIKTRRKELYYSNREENIKSVAEWAKQNPEKVRANKSRWKENHKDLVLLDQVKRREAVVRATPKWCDNELDQLLFKEIYHLRYLRTKLTGIKHHVDHIIPLNSDLVCGLHCPSNLRVITAELNLKKGNKFDIEEFNNGDFGPAD